MADRDYRFFCFFAALLFYLTAFIEQQFLATGFCR